MYENLHKGFAPIALLIAMVTVLLIGGITYFAFNYQASNKNVPEKNTLTFITPVESENLTRGNSQVIIWDGMYSDKLTLKIVSTPAGSNMSYVVADNVSSPNKRNQIVWNIPCNFDTSLSWYKLIFVDKKTNTVVASGPAFGFAVAENATCLDKPQPSQTKTYSDTVFGFSFSYPKSWAVSTDANGVIKIEINSETTPITIKTSKDSGTDSNGKFGTVIISSNGSQWTRQQSNERDGGLNAPTNVNPSMYTSSNLPIFSGAITNHDWGRYSYIVALSKTKYLTIEGPDKSSTSERYNAENDPTLYLVKSLKLN